MSLLELFILAVALSMDAFAVAICIGLALPKATIKSAAIVGAYFGVFQAVIPLAGYLVASIFADKIVAYDHWIAFALLCFLGGKMIYGSLSKGDSPDTGNSLSPAKMFPLAIATSIDALAVGVSLAFLRSAIVPAVIFIGCVTLALSMAAVKIGNVFGMRFKSKAELAGGIILVLIGVKIMLEHLGIIAF